ncbi:MAG TPA: heterodisulfide reductase-related iron-sulfur binding cluster [Streptosporangiaceae bacterium]|jgi:glycolate oxidase iron-sulfur subunit
MADQGEAGPGPGGALGELRSLAGDCVHCGFCLPVCPTYQLWGEEMDSPRGRIHLISQVLNGAELSDATAEHLDRCLGCMACVPACPSGVQYDRLIEAARVWVNDARDRPALEAEPGDHRRTLRERAARAAIFAVFPYPRRLRLMTGPLRAAQRTGLDQKIRRSPLPGRLSPELAAALALAPPPAGRTPPLPRRVASRGPRRAVVGMLTGCVQGIFFPQVNTATARVLAAEGCDVVIPNGEACCGALSLHSGRRRQAQRLARRVIATFERANVETIVVNSAGCGSAMKEYAHLLADDPAWAGRAEALAARVRDFAEFLADLDGAAGPGGPAGPDGLAGPAAVRHPLPVRAVYHDACHLGHAQGIKAQPRALLRSIPGLELLETGDGGTCCGSAGVYNLLQPEAARELGDRKAATIEALGAELLISANPGCSLQIATALAARGVSMPVAHTAQVLDASIRGLPATSLVKIPR